MEIVYGYGRVSSGDQNEDRQLAERKILLCSPCARRLRFAISFGFTTF